MQISSENFFEPPKSEVNGLNFREAKCIEMPKIKPLETATHLSVSTRRFLSGKSRNLSKASNRLFWTLFDRLKIVEK